MSAAVSPNPSRWYSLRPQVVSSHECADRYSAGASKRTLCRSPGFSLCIAFSFLELCPVNASCLGLSRLLALFLQLREFAILCLGSPSLYHSLKTVKAISWDNHRAHLIYYLSLRDHCLLLPAVSVLKPLFHVFCHLKKSFQVGKRI